ncbi:hypothetical protein B0T22DRAFT_440950 [Podospora appendiculata]|uniref:Uncharacterized protein n=1 Tax=Podospora appendiculata TaxID=314037 RepID=A0AAE0XBL7_9PEZI|nr:hypothetical protein B0T22DRAFT_440950 [Podospora appendiculata]
MPSKSADDFDEPLMSEEADGVEDVEMSPGRELQARPFSRRRGIFKFQARVPWMSLIPWTLFLGLSHWVLHQYQRRGPTNPIFPQMLYSPAQNALEYEVRKFRLGLDGDTTEFQGQPSPELDKNWSNLYDSKRIGNQSDPTRDGGQAAKQRRSFSLMTSSDDISLNWTYSTSFTALTWFDRPCIPSITNRTPPVLTLERRTNSSAMTMLITVLTPSGKSLMCNADISVLMWRWNKKQKKNMEMGTILHTCRRFDKIQEWARKHAVYHNMDNEHREMNDPLDPDTWVDGFSG